MDPLNWIATLIAVAALGTAIGASLRARATQAQVSELRAELDRLARR